MSDSKCSDIHVTPELLQRYDRPGPRYTSYPTAPVWKEDFGDSEYRKALTRAAGHEDDPLSVYVHIPFCHERCAFCGCNVIIGRKEGLADAYLDYVIREMEAVAKALGRRKRVLQVHWGGGTPTYLDLSQMQRLFNAIGGTFAIDPNAELALEMDPRVTSQEQIALLRSMGFNRVSMGVQDLDPNVQCEIHRNQTEEQTRQLFAWCREAGFGGINFDLIYGLPGQELPNWEETIRKVIEIGPDRIAVYSYAYLPDRLRNQRHIDVDKLPKATLKLELFSAARRLFLEAGYSAIGMDHFAKPHDELAIAMRERRLHRNFMGYTVVPAPEMLGFGTSAIGEIGGCFAQNEKKLSRYYQAIDAGKFPTACGIALTQDDVIRKYVIKQLMCNFYLDFAELESLFGVEYSVYFAAEDETLKSTLDEGFISRESGALRVLPLGQVFIRNIAMVFDAYLPKVTTQFSRTV
ncbi:MAG: oxygen-independent coproporphyrinogen III oxidase [Candidatus Hydrogenedentes bacterium]|nr:oxygen-independent coproporphyrinogen III oxidase [Candidatus Hydrogenedentota bacterium]